MNSNSRKFIAAGIACLLLSFIGLGVFLLFTILIPNLTFRFDNSYAYTRFLFFSLLICMAFAFLFVVVLYNIRVQNVTKGIMTSAAGTLLIYLISVIAGVFDLNDMEAVALLCTIAFMGFLLPFLYRRIYQTLRKER